MGAKNIDINIIYIPNKTPNNRTNPNKYTGFLLHSFKFGPENHVFVSFIHYNIINK